MDAQRVRTTYLPYDVEQPDLGTYTLTRVATGELISSTKLTYNQGAGRPMQKREMCTDEIHPNHPFEGGPFLSSKGWAFRPFYDDARAFAVSREKYGIEYRAAVDRVLLMQGIYPAGFDKTLEIVLPTPGLSETYGVEAWNRLKPAPPEANLGQFLAELRDLPRMLRSTHQYFLDLFRHQNLSWRKLIRSNAGQWINTNFGWMPFLRDLRSFYYTAKQIDGILKKLRRDSGKWKKRRVVVEEDSTRELIDSDSNAIWVAPYINSKLMERYYSPSVPYGYWNMWEDTVNRVWATGKFRYYIPESPDWLWKGKAVAHLFGLIPNPSLLWELTPYSWLVDWVSNVGSLIHMIDYELVDDLVAKDLYLMRSQSKTYAISGKQYWKGYTSSHEFSHGVSHKERVEGGNFGFSLAPDDFTLRQWSILGALGLTKLL